MVIGGPTVSEAKGIPTYVYNNNPTDYHSHFPTKISDLEFGAPPDIDFDDDYDDDFDDDFV